MGDMLAEDRELRALLSLLETETESAVAIMLEQMRAFPDNRLQHLSRLMAPTAPAQRYVNLVLAERQSALLQAAFLDWRRSGAALEDGLMLLVRTGYPTVDIPAIRRQLDAMAREVRYRLTAEEDHERLRQLTQLVSGEWGFAGNEEHFYDPDNTYLNRVLDRRIGLPITLSALYIVLGERAGLRISGLSLPRHFIAMYSGRQPLYFDPYRRGEILSLAEVMREAHGGGQGFSPSMLQPASSVLIVQRMLLNLQKAYEMSEDIERSSLVRQYLAALR